MRLVGRPTATPDPERLVETDGPAAEVLRAYARRTRPEEVERWLPRASTRRGVRARTLSRSAAAFAGGATALLGVWLVTHPGDRSEPGPRGGAGGAEGASGWGMFAGGGRGASGTGGPVERSADDKPPAG